MTSRSDQADTTSSGRFTPPLRLAAALAASFVLTIIAARAGSANGAPPRVTGRIEGTVRISAALSTRRAPFRIYSDPGTGGVPLPPAGPRDALAAEMRNVVLYLEGDSALSSASPPQRAMRGSITQRDERFVPHVLPVVRGATVEFPNDDDVYHNVFSLSSAAGPKGFDLGRYPRGTSRSVALLRAGTVQVFCHIHSDMSAFVLVLTNPFFASPDEDRRFVIDDVPEGDYTIVAWHERIKPITKRIHVVAGQTATTEFNIPLPATGSGR